MYQGKSPFDQIYVYLNDGYKDYRYYVQVPFTKNPNEKITFSTDDLREALDYRNEKWLFGSGQPPRKYYMSYRKEDPNFTMEEVEQGIYKTQYVTPNYTIVDGVPVVSYYRLNLISEVDARPKVQILRIKNQDQVEETFLAAVETRDHNTQVFNEVAEAYNKAIHQQVLVEAFQEVKDLTPRTQHLADFLELHWKSCRDEIREEKTRKFHEKNEGDDES